MLMLIEAEVETCLEGEAVGQTAEVNATAIQVVTLIAEMIMAVTKNQTTSKAFACSLSFPLFA
jgi:hypothetical protein